MSKRIFPHLAALLVASLAGLVGLVAYEAWRLDRGLFRAELGPVAGFADRYAYESGELVPLSVHASRPSRLVMRRFDSTWFDVGDPIGVPASPQSPIYDKRRGFDWKTNLMVSTESLPPGLYQFRLETLDDAKSSFAIPIIIKTREAKAIGVVLSTNTWEAYNTYGGTSHYEVVAFTAPTRYLLDLAQKVLRRHIGKRLPYVPRKRPNELFDREANIRDSAVPFSSFLVRTELEFLAFLQREGYSISIYSDEDLVNDPEVRRSRVLVFPGHSEYWSDDMIRALEDYLESGGRLFRAVAGLEGGVRRTEHGWAFERSIGRRDIERLVGAVTTSAGQLTAAPYEVLCPDMWVFRGTGLAAGGLFGEDSLNRPSFDLPGHHHFRYTLDLAGQPQRGASGIFTSKVLSDDGDFAVLARGTNPQGGADMVYRDLPSGGWVFNASSHAFNGALQIDPFIAQIARNLMDEASGAVQRPAHQRACP
jgi:hypothetical protein